MCVILQTAAPEEMKTSKRIIEVVASVQQPF